MNWFRLGEALVLPPVLFSPVAWWLWSRSRVELATVVLMAGFLVTSLFFAAVEFVDCDRTRIACMVDGIKSACLAIAHGPSDVVRVGAYGVVAFVQIMALFVAGGAVEKRIRNATVDPAWRR